MARQRLQVSLPRNGESTYVMNLSPGSTFSSWRSAWEKQILEAPDYYWSAFRKGKISPFEAVLCGDGWMQVSSTDVPIKRVQANLLDEALNERREMLEHFLSGFFNRLQKIRLEMGCDWFGSDETLSDVLYHPFRGRVSRREVERLYFERNYVSLRARHFWDIEDEKDGYYNPLRQRCLPFDERTYFFRSIDEAFQFVEQVLLMMEDFPLLCEILDIDSMLYWLLKQGARR